ncbi:unnamed protein product [Gongylonema pulchrum]|uniref:C2H2-type domain-containing protein n=1 Tax=Gongylonema pulchrum TaxID=637853 RepID=A0A183EPJ5_9BILA|nr:unnamed protein product [Gongylonema pulchrum]
MQRHYSAAFLEELRIALETAYALQLSAMLAARSVVMSCPLCGARSNSVTLMSKHFEDKHNTSLSGDAVGRLVKVRVCFFCA